MANYTTGWVAWRYVPGPYFTGSGVVEYQGSKYLIDVSGIELGSLLSGASYIQFEGSPQELAGSAAGFGAAIGLGVGISFGTGGVAAIAEVGGLGFAGSYSWTTVIPIEPGGAGLGGSPELPSNKGRPPSAPPPLPKDPLVFDLDGDGVELIALADSSAFFNMDDDPAAENVAWVGPDDGLLVLDANGNGQIDDLSELFGNATTNGFVELATLNSDGNGVINSADAQFGALRIWRDADGDGATDAGELHALSTFGIASIDLAYQQTALNNAGNLVDRVGAYTKTRNTAPCRSGQLRRRSAHYRIYTALRFQYDPDTAHLPT